MTTVGQRDSDRQSTRVLFVATASVLIGFGVLMVHSASITSWPTEFERVYLSKHLTFLVIASISAAGCAALPARFWWHAAPWLFVATVLLLIAVLLPGVGTRVNGAQRWLRYGLMSFQPSELAKITLPLFVGRLLVSRRDQLRHWWNGIIPVIWPIFVVIPLVMIEPDFGTALFLAGGAAILLWVGHWPLRNFVLTIALAVPASLYLVAMKPYQVRRVTGFLAAWSDLNEAPYQLRQSLVSLGEGGIFGVGLGRGWQKLSYLPEANTDFVVAVVGEELGLIGTLGLLAVWIGLFFLGTRLLAPYHRGGFIYITGLTLLVQLSLQAALNMAVVTALVPPKGIPHPLVSYGGSNLLMSIVTLGLLVGYSRSGDDLASDTGRNETDSRQIER